MSQETPEERAESATEAIPKRRRRGSMGRIIVAVLALAVVGLLVRRAALPKQVAVVHPARQMVVQALTASGRVKGAREVELSVERPGVLVEVLVEEGDTVEVGQAVARLSADVEAAQLTQAEAAISTGRAQLAEAIASAEGLPPAIEQTRAEVEGGIRQAQARLDQATARLEELRVGAREEERKEAGAAVERARLRVAQAEREVTQADALAEADATARAALSRAEAAAADAQARIQQAQALLDQASTDLTRSENLYERGVIPRAEYDRALTARDTADQALEQAKAQHEQAQVEVRSQHKLLEVTRQSELVRWQTELAVAEKELEAALARQGIVLSGARAEQIAQQEAEVRNARAALVAAREAGQARLASVMATPASERVEVARRRLAEATRARDTVAAQLRTTEVEASFRGTVTEIVQRPGDSVNPGQPIMLLSEMEWPEVHLELDERDIAWVKRGQQAAIIADAFRDRQLAGEVERIAARAETERGVIDVVIVPTEEARWLRSGMTVDASIVVAPEKELLVIPTAAVMRAQDQAFVMVIEQGVAERRPVKLGLPGQAGTAVLAGLTEEDLVVGQPLSVKAGARVRPAQTERSED